MSGRREVGVPFEEPTSCNLMLRDLGSRSLRDSKNIGPELAAGLRRQALQRVGDAVGVSICARGRRPSLHPFALGVPQGLALGFE